MVSVVSDLEEKELSEDFRDIEHESTLQLKGSTVRKLGKALQRVGLDLELNGHKAKYTFTSTDRGLQYLQVIAGLTACFIVLYLWVYG